MINANRRVQQEMRNILEQNRISEDVREQLCVHMMDTWQIECETQRKRKAYPARLASIPLTGGGDSACPNRSLAGWTFEDNNTESNWSR